MDQLRQDARDTCDVGTDPTDRADVRAAAAGAAIAERNVNSVMYSFLPTIDFLSTLNHSSVETFSSPQTTWTIGGALTWHLYDGGQRYGEKQLNEALLEQRRQDSIDAERNARLEVTQATRGVRVARDSLQIAEQSRQIAQDNAKLARAKFINGSGTSFDMVDTQRTAREAELDVTVKEFDLLRAEIIAFLALASCDL
jgi:outer membrane protein TolC